MYKKGIILLTFLAYSLTLVHSLVPHHHHDEASHAHHHHGIDHDHGDDADEGKSISHVFADAIHNPASEVFVQGQERLSIPKKNICVAILVVKLNQLLVPEFKPPDWTFTYQEKYHSSAPDSFFLLRAPPIA